MSSKKTKPPKDDSTTNPDDKCRYPESTNRHVYIEPGVKIDIVEDLREQYKSAQKDQTTQNNKQLFWTKIGAGLIFIYALLTGYQACLTRSQFIKDQRPWVWFKPKPVEFVDDWQKLNTAPFKWGISVTNYGKSPAVEVFFCSILSVATAPAGIETQFTEKQIMSACGGPKNPNVVKGGIPPGDEITATRTPTHGYSPEVLKFIKDTDDALALTGYVEYRDLAGTKYRSVFCAERLAAGGIQICGPNINKIE